MKILLAEDDLKMAEYLCAGLIENGHSVDHVTDGREALSYCLYQTCDIVILDRMMPGMDGLSVLKALRAALCGPNPQHVLIYGPPGVGKTAAARLVLVNATRITLENALCLLGLTAPERM